MPIKIEKQEWGLRVVASGRIAFNEMWDSLKDGWEIGNWDAVDRRLTIYEPGLVVDYEDHEPDLLAQIMAASQTRKLHQFKSAIVIPTDDTESRKFIERYFAALERASDAVGQIFDDEKTALKWLIGDTDD